MDVSFATLVPFFDYLEIRGLSSTKVRAECGLAEDIFDSSSRIAIKQYDAVWQSAFQALKDPQLGLHYGAYLQLTALGIIYQISRACDTIEQALPYLADTISALLPIVSMTQSEKNGDYVIRLQANASWCAHSSTVAHQTLCALMLLVYREMQVMGGNQDLHLALAYPFAANEQNELQELIGIKTSFSDSYEITFDKHALNWKLAPVAGYRLEVLIMEFQKFILETRKEKMQPRDVITLSILNMLGEGAMPTVESVAFCFNQSKRTFQRRLSEQGDTYRAILDDLLKELSKRLLRHKKLSVNDISYTLGYAEASSFIHAYERWYDSSPRKS